MTTKLPPESTLFQIIGPGNSSIAIHIVGTFSAATFEYIGKFAEFQRGQLEKMNSSAAAATALGDGEGGKP